jgi:predicted nucleic acid-binding Zn ribbon protein
VHATLGPAATLQEYEMSGTAAIIEDITKRLNAKLREERIILKHWSDIPLLYNTLHTSGDLARLNKMRQQYGAATI